ncbi:MAG: histidine phosphatase family protein [Acidobacteria bacterium]|nr:histidine phosphatase family protein [Acidobacteriota bacterium]
MRPLILGLTLIAILPLKGQAPPAERPLEGGTTIVIIRHAEKADDADPDSPISAAGRARARALVPQLAAFKPDALIVSQRRRTAETLAPLAAQVKLIPLVRDNERVDELASELLREFKGRTVVLGWHHGPHEPLARALGVKGELPQWTSKTYDRIWVIRIEASGRVTFEERVQAPVVPTPTIPKP